MNDLTSEILESENKVAFFLAIMGIIPVDFLVDKAQIDALFHRGRQLWLIFDKESNETMWQKVASEQALIQPEYWRVLRSERRSTFIAWEAGDIVSCDRIVIANIIEFAIGYFGHINRGNDQYKERISQFFELIKFLPTVRAYKDLFPTGVTYVFVNGTQREMNPGHQIFRDSFVSRAERHTNRLSKLEGHNAPEFILDGEREIISYYLDCVRELDGNGLPF